MAAQEYTNDGYEVRHVKNVIRVSRMYDSMMALLNLNSTQGKVAFIDPKDTQIYVSNRKFHREGSAAVIYSDYSGDNEEWFLNNNFHRIDGPAVTKSNGEQRWYLNGIRHRIGGPAVIERSAPIGNEGWFLNRKRHDIDIDRTAIKLWWNEKALWRNIETYIKEGDDFWNPNIMESGYVYQYWYEGKLLDPQNEDFGINLMNMIYPDTIKWIG